MSAIRIAGMDRLLNRNVLAMSGRAVEAAGGQEGVNIGATYRPDLIILDMGLPDLGGVEVVKRLREWTRVPIIILSVREQDRDKIEALDAGADGYVTKPSSMGELLARIWVAIRHINSHEDEPVITVGGLSIDLAHRRVSVDEREVKLTPTEYELLKYMAQNAGKVITHRQLLITVWGQEYRQENHYLRIYVGTVAAENRERPRSAPLHYHRARYRLTGCSAGQSPEG